MTSHLINIQVEIKCRKIITSIPQECTCFRAIYRWRSRGGGGGGGGGRCSGSWSTPLCPGHKPYVNVRLLADFYLPWQTSFVQANIEVQSSNVGGVVTFWSMLISNYCIAA